LFNRRGPRFEDVASAEKGGLPKDPINGVHVSNHNAVKKLDNRAWNFENDWAHKRQRELEQLDKQYAKVCKRYQRKKKADETPARENDVYVNSAYGYPTNYSPYMPYYAEPTCEDDRYSSVGGGRGCGSCAAGTCSESASMGSCAGCGDEVSIPGIGGYSSSFVYF
jgi:hypothetical protein